MLIAITILLFIIGSLLIMYTDYQVIGALIATIGIMTIFLYNLSYALYQWIKRKL